MDAGKSIRANLSGLSGDANLQLLDSNGVILAQSNAAGTNIDDLSATAVTTGSHFLRVWNAGTVSTPFTLTVSQDVAGDDLIVNPTSLGSLAETRPTARAQGTVSRIAAGAIDSQDYYRVALSTTSDLRINLSGLGADGQVELLDAAGRAITVQITTENGIANLFVPGLAAGRYVLRVFCDTVGTFPYDLTVSTAASGDDLPSGAFSMGTLTPVTLPAVRQTGIVGGADSQDYHRLTLNATSTLRVNLSNLSNDLDMELLNASGQRLGFNRLSGLNFETITVSSLPAGNYLIRVFPASGTVTSRYDLAASINATTDDLIIQAASLGSLTAARPTVAVSNTVGGPVDIQDYYRFVLQTPGDLQVVLSGMAGDLSIALLDQFGRTNESAIGTNPSTILETFTVTALAAGTYYLRVFPTLEATVSTYDLVVSTNVGSDELIPGAAPLGVLSSIARPTAAVRSRVGGPLDTQDYYQFDVTAPTTLRVNLSGMTANLNVQLLTVDGQTIMTGANGGTVVENLLTTTLLAGSYLVRVYPTASESNYELSVSVATSQDDSLTAAFSLGSFNSSRPSYFSSGLTVGGSADIQDYFRLALSASSQLQVNLSGISNDAAGVTVELLSAVGIVLASTPTVGSQIEFLASSLLTAGTYYLRVFAPGANSRYDLAVSILNSSDDLISKAIPLGNIDTTPNAFRIANDVVGNVLDIQDYYSFELAQPTVVRINLSNLTNDLNIRLLNSDGVSIAAGLNFGNAIENVLTSTLPVGRYFLRVYPASSTVASSYELIVSADTASDDLISNAAFLGALDINSNTRTLFAEGVISPAVDQRDFYRITLPIASDLRVELSGMTSDADVTLLNSSGVTLAVSSFGGTSIDTFTETQLPAGDYFIKVTRFSGDTDYIITASVQLDSNDLLAGAVDIGNLNIVTRPTTSSMRIPFENSVNIQDNYRFTLDALSNLRVVLSGLSNNLDLALLDADGRVVASSQNTGTAIDALQLLDLAAGTYYLRVRGIATSSVYDLCTTTNLSSDDVLALATNLGTIGNTVNVRQTRNALSALDIQDYYRFNWNEASDFALSLSGLSTDADVELLDSQGRPIASSAFGDNNPESISVSALPAGIYFIRVSRFSGGATSYDLALTNQSNDGLLFSQALGTLTVVGSVGQTSDELTSARFQRYFIVPIRATIDFRGTLSNLSVNADLELLDSFGRVIASSTASGNTIENLFASNLTPGQYYFRVFSAQPGTTPFTLTASSDTTSDDMLVNASAFAGTSGAVRGSGILDGQSEFQDAWVFTVVSGASSVRANLSGITTTGTLALMNALGQTLASVSINSSIVDFTSPVLATGTYYWVLQATRGAPSSPYDLNLTLSSASTNLIVNAFVVSSAPTTIVGRLTATDIQQYIKVVLPVTGSTTTVTLSNLTVNLDLQLLNLDGQLSQQSVNNGTTNEILISTPGVFFIRVFPRVPGVATEYTLTIRRP